MRRLPLPRHNESQSDRTGTLCLFSGIKLEYNSYTSVELLPTVRLAWKTTPNSQVWAALARSVRSPSRIDHDFYGPSSLKMVAGVPQYALGGGPDFAPEVAKVLELGYRAQLMPEPFNPRLCS